MAGNSSQVAGTIDAGLEPWRRFFDGAGIFNVVTNAIIVAGEGPSSPPRHVSAEDSASNNNVEEMVVSDERISAECVNHDYNSAGAFADDCLNKLGDDMEEIQKVLRIKAVILNHRHEQPIDLFKSMRWLEVMPLTVETRKSTGIEDAVRELPKQKSSILRGLVRDITKGWKVGADGIAKKKLSGRQAPTSSRSSAPMATQDINIDFYHDKILTTVTSSAQEVESFIWKVRGDHSHHLIVGLDTEWRVVQEDGKLRHRTALLQLCVDKRCLVFQIHLTAVVPEVLKDFLTCPQCKFVGAGVEGDIERLSLDYRIEVPTWSDLQSRAMKLKGYSMPPSLKCMVQDMMDVTMNKDIVHNFWGEPELTLRQIEYAAIDAFVSSKLALLMGIKPATKDVNE